MSEEEKTVRMDEKRDISIHISEGAKVVNIEQELVEWEDGNSTTIRLTLEEWEFDDDE